jgi:AcrR family transcriptional regulator
VSPAAARTSREEIVAAARDLLETGGIEAVTMQAVAGRVGIRGPSLYKRFASRAALLAAIAEDAFADQARIFARAIRGDDPATDLRRVAVAYRRWAHRHPGTYGLLFAPVGDDARPPAEAGAQAAAPVINAVAEIVGRDHALDAARLLTAFVHGFVSMELARAFRLGGDTNAAFEYGIAAVLRSLERGKRRP